MLPIQPKVLNAIIAGRGRVTVASVAASTGVALHVAARELNQVAAISQAVLQVSRDGTLVYVFPDDLTKKVEKDALKTELSRAAKVALKVGSYVLRVSFGLLLISSFATLMLIFAFALIIILAASGGSGGHGGGHNGGFGGGHFGLTHAFFDLRNLMLFFAIFHNDSPNYKQLNYMGKRVDFGDRGFLFNCYSFLFGDGNPNVGFPDQSAQYIASLIRLNNGVITAEQAAPYLATNSILEDRAMFPILVRFDGMPEVTGNGDIAYVFPRLQQSATNVKLLRQLPVCAEEEESWRFTNVPIRNLDMVFFFAGANLAGWYALSHNAGMLHLLGGYAQVVPWAFAYSVFFLVFPILRELANAVRNGFIEYRNQLRKKAAAQLSNPEVQAKIHEARAFAIAMQNVHQQQVAYTTDRDVEQQFSA